MLMHDTLCELKQTDFIFYTDVQGFHTSHDAPATPAWITLRAKWMQCGHCVEGDS